MTTTTDEVQEQIRDVILVLNQIVKRQLQQGVRLPEDIAVSWKRLADSLLSEAEHSATRLQDLKMQRGRLIVRRGELDVLRREQDWLLANPKGQNPGLLLRTKENATRTAADHDACLKQLARVESEIAAAAA